MHGGPSERVDAVELFAGKKAATTADRKRGRVAVAYDRDHDPKTMNILKPSGCSWVGFGIR
eukprot:440033-Alexandrium_andersonii.AAC.1